MLEFLRASLVLTKQAFSACSQVISTSKMSSRYALFSMLGYAVIYGPRNKNSMVESDEQMIAGKKEAYAKMYELSSKSEGATSAWRTLRLSEVCSKTTKNVLRNERPAGGVHNLFSYDEERRAFDKFRKYKTGEMILSTLVRFDSMTADLVDSLQIEIEENHANEQDGLSRIDVVDAPHGAIKDGDSNDIRRRRKYQKRVVPQLSS